MLLCFQKTDLSKTFTLFKFDKNWPYIEYVIVFCAICHMALLGVRGLKHALPQTEEPCRPKTL